MAEHKPAMSQRGEGSRAPIDLTPTPVPQRGLSGAAAVALAVGAVVIVVAVGLFGQDERRGPAASPAAIVGVTPTPSGTPAPTRLPSPGPSTTEPPDRGRGNAAAVLPTGGTPLPDIAGALPGDDGRGPLPLGTVRRPPENDRLDFLFELCPGQCFRDAHWIDSGNPLQSTGTWTAGRPFHVREGFINERAEPLGDGFDVVLYVTRLDGAEDEPTYRFASDYVLRGRSERCGPTYRAQAASATCEWFVHDFPDGLAEGRFAIWAVWEAPCQAWVDLGRVAACGDPAEVLALFSSGFDAPYQASAPVYGEPSTRGHPFTVDGASGG